ncbi:conserved domain protein [delta proteobacterium NaphS2]|nr:conserved domain protein [delta proteobacterium NaphS2]
METLLAAIERGEGEDDFPPRLQEMCRHMRNAYCAFALGAASPVQGLLEDFGGEVKAHITQKRCPLEHGDLNPWPLAPMPGIEDLETGHERYPSCPV